ncbi:MAG: ATP synthase subunit C [Spirochaetales bacterium]
MNRKTITLMLFFLCFTVGSVFAQDPQAETEGSTGAVEAIAAAVAVSAACIGGGMAVGKIGAAAMGAMSENENLSGKALPFVGLAEGICLWGFLVALLILVL